MRRLRYDPAAPLLATDSRALLYLARRDLLGAAAPVDRVWDLPEVMRLLGRQQPDGSWKYPGGNPAIRSRGGYDQLETYRQLGVLVEKYCLDRRHQAVARAAEFLGSFQSEAGDYRGIYGNQYSPNYSAAISELLIKAGFARGEQVERTLRWLVSARQDDGGWAIPIRTLGLRLEVMRTATEALEPDRSRPSSHLVTGIVLRALAAHPRYRRSRAARDAGRLLKRRLFTRDSYPDRAAPSYWLVFSYPFWWTDLLSALDSLTQLGFGPDDPDIGRAVDWFVDNQEPNGLWNTGRNRPKGRHSDLWVALAVIRVLKRCLGDGALVAAGVSSREGPIRERQRADPTHLLRPPAHPDRRDVELVARARAALRSAADPDKAEPMRAYMKSAQPFLGVQGREQRAAYRQAFSEHRLPDFASWRDSILALWREASYREERYAAIALARDRRYRSFALRLEALPLYEELIVAGAWWDLVDSVAIHLLGGLLREHPLELRRALLAWSPTDDIWKRRAAIIAQNALKEDADPDLLYACIEPSLGRREFFLRKAIGWALRERARTEADEVRRYVRKHEAELSPLSRREALKHIPA